MPINSNTSNRIEMYYTYAYLREDGTPYYIGKGKGKRIHRNSHSVNRPPLERRIFLKQNLTEEEAFRHERYMIAVLGRKDNGTGILRNRTDGGEGVSGKVTSEETKEKLRQISLNMPEEQREKIRQYNLNMPQEQRDLRAEKARGNTNKRGTYKFYYKTGETEIIDDMCGIIKERGWNRGNLYSLQSGRLKSACGVVRIEKLNKV